MEKEDNKKIEKDIVAEDVSEEEAPNEKEENETITKDEDVTDGGKSKEEKDEEAGEASFQKVSSSKLPFIAVIIAVVIIAGALFFSKGFSPYLGAGGGTEYINQVHGYSYKYPSGVQLVAAGSIPAELAAQGVESMEQLNLTDGDSLLVDTNKETGDNIVYTVLELSSRPNYVDFDSYSTALFASLDESKEVTGTDYIVNESKVGKNITSTEYSFEMEVPINEQGDTRTGVFYDNIFQTKDGKAYSISFGYPKDVENPDEYLGIYRDILSSFRTNVIETEPVVENADNKKVETLETEPITEVSVGEDED